MLVTFHVFLCHAKRWEMPAAVDSLGNYGHSDEMMTMSTNAYLTPNNSSFFTFRNRKIHLASDRVKYISSTTGVKGTNRQ